MACTSTLWRRRGRSRVTVGVGEFHLVTLVVVSLLGARESIALWGGGNPAGDHPPAADGQVVAAGAGVVGGRGGGGVGGDGMTGGVVGDVHGTELPDVKFDPCGSDGALVGRTRCLCMFSCAGEYNVCA